MLPPAPVSQEEMQARFPWMRPGAVKATPIVPSVFGTRETIGRSPTNNPLFEHCVTRGVLSFVMGACLRVCGGLWWNMFRDREEGRVGAAMQPVDGPWLGLLVCLVVALFQCVKVPCRQACSVSTEGLNTLCTTEPCTQVLCLDGVGGGGVTVP